MGEPDAALQAALERQAQLKAQLLQAKNFPGMPADPSKLTLYFSPVFITADVLLGRKQRAALKDSDSLSVCQMVNDDIVYIEFPAK